MVNQLLRGLLSTRIVASKRGLSHAYQQRGVPSSFLDVGCRGAQPGTTDSAILSCRQTVAQVLIVRRTDQVAKSFNIDGLDLSGEICAGGDLQAARNRNPKNQ